MRTDAMLTVMEGFFYIRCGGTEVRGKQGTTKATRHGPRAAQSPSSLRPATSSTEAKLEVGGVQLTVHILASTKEFLATMLKKPTTPKSFQEFRDPASRRDASGRLVSVAIEIVVSGTSSTDRQERILEVDYLIPVPEGINWKPGMTTDDAKAFLNNFLLGHMQDVSIRL